MEAARRHGTIVSYDLNYRRFALEGRGGKNRRRPSIAGLAPLVDVMLGNEEDFSAALGFEVPGMEHLCEHRVKRFKQMIEQVVEEFQFGSSPPRLRKATTATRNDWGAICWADGGFYEAPNRENLEIFDRVGGGDSFSSGLIYGFLAGRDPVGGGMWRGAWRTRHDHTRRHVHGQFERGPAGDERQAAGLIGSQLNSRRK